jgi:hypothetical protein
VMFYFILHRWESRQLSRYCDSLRAARPRIDYRHEKDFSLHHSVQAGSGAHPASYQMGTGGKVPRAWSWTLTSN